MKKSTFQSYIKAANFRELFITEMGWNNYQGQAALPPIVVEETEYQFMTIADRNGFQILLCEVKSIPSASLCRRMDTKLRRSAHDYIAIFVEQDTEHHLWMAPVRQVEKRNVVTIEYESAGQADFLYTKVGDLSFDLDEQTTIVDVKQRVQQTFAVNSEKITKDFYAGFKREHDAFAAFISGIDNNITDLKSNRNKQWYTSVMLNRLMFCYFIQKKGFLDGNVNYLRDKLTWCQKQRGENQCFKSFYRGFLVQLFQDGLNAPRHQQEFELNYGKIPYLNGGMFDQHQIERDYQDIDIDDAAFERLFDFFDKWRWHLDTRISASGKDINPDVLGYIFEQYINDRAQMGAYYTKEDITEYIGRNCILPFLLNKLTITTPKAFAPKGEVWTRLRQSGDRYLFEAVKQGYSSDWRTLIPENIAVGLDTTLPDLLERRWDWNIRTPEPFGLPTEIWRETIERLQRCEDVLDKISGGELHEVNDFITYNLDIRHFTQDLLEQTADHLLVGHFYHALQQVTILDPTCGSGAFLFAALNILEPLYEACISRMEEFNRQNPLLFKAELEEITAKYRSNIQYFIYKSIILRNLYGVDIMAEAVEIAKLRLFLKMVAVVDADRRAPNLGLDPLPDIDFNIRCGNTLVGYASEEEVLAAHASDLFTQGEFQERMKTEMTKVAKAYEHFRHIQLAQHEDMAEFKTAKKELRTRLTAFTKQLNRQMYSAHFPGKEFQQEDYEAYLSSHQPFHWFAEYYQIIHGKGGFDVIIGNPPYVEYTRKQKDTKVSISQLYKLIGYSTLPTSNLYAFTIERSSSIIRENGKVGMIIPVSGFSNGSMKELQDLFKTRLSNLYLSTYHQRPAQLFDGVLQRLCIFIAEREEATGKNIYTTEIYRWTADTRIQLFDCISYVNTDESQQAHFIKLGSNLESSIFAKYSKHQMISHQLSEVNTKENNVYYRTAGGGYWVTFLNNEFDCISVSNKSKSLSEKYNAKVVASALNSNLFWWYYSINYDLFNFKDYMIFGFQMTYPDVRIEEELMRLSDRLEASLRTNALFYNITSKTRGTNETVTYQKSKSKPIIDEIDKVLAKHYGFTEEELDFIINYDIKYRMGEELGEE